jgi:transposase
MKPYSKDLRLKVLAAVERSMPRRRVAEVFGVSVPTIKRWLKRRRETGGVEPKPVPGRTRPKRWTPSFPLRLA